MVGEEVKGVGVMKDEEVKLEEIEASHHQVDKEGVDATLSYYPWRYSFYFEQQIK